MHLEQFLDMLEAIPWRLIRPNRVALVLAYKNPMNRLLSGGPWLEPQVGLYPACGSFFLA
jgi:hypothetical protein